MRGSETPTLTDLEGAALAVIARDGAMTAYALAREFAASPARFWSGSAGAIYPLTARLERRGLLSGMPGARGRRSSTAYSITPDGRRALEAWLLDVDRAADMGFDPLRTRLPFLTLVAAAERAPFLEAVARRTAALGGGDIFQGRPDAVELHLSWIDARLAWLRKLGARMGRRES